MTQKTISGHYDTVYSIAHNNREFIPKNVDVGCTPWNYACVAAGQGNDGDGVSIYLEGCTG